MTAAAPALPPPVPDRRFGQAIVLFGVCLVLLLTLGVASQFVSPVGGLTFTLVALVLLPALAFVRLKGIGLQAGLRLVPAGPGVLLGSLLAGVGGWGVAVAIHGLVESAIGTQPGSGLGAGGSPGLVTMLLVGALLPGVCEEVLFRGAIQGVLERRGPRFAVAVSGLLFGVFHLDPWRILPAAFLGCLFGWLVMRSGSLFPAIVAHAGNNATALSVGELMETRPGWLLPALTLVLALAIAIVLTRTRRPVHPPGHPLARVPAGLPRAVAWAAGFAVVLASIVLVSAGLFVASLVTTIEAADDELAPHIEAGDTLVLVRSGSIAFDPAPGETVAFRRGDETVSRVVVRVERGGVVVLDGEEEVRVAAEDLVGELVHIVSRDDPGATDE